MQLIVRESGSAESEMFGMLEIVLAGFRVVTGTFRVDG